MEVLKGAPATALYGSRGIHGVVLLKTKTTQVIVDGIIRDHGYLTKMDPNLIESIDILKDSTASYLHCSRGNYGVIMVTTKRPRIQVTVDSSGRQLHTFRYGSLSDSSLYPYLVILNGIPIENEKLSTLTAGNIQSVDILHESVTARISCRALGGVVVITTKCRYTDELPVF
jgi:TonB-dependent SusC/RagA subfamily outer membrane receptor